MFRVTIRDLLWLTVVVAVSVGWWAELRNRGPENTKLRAENARVVKERDTANWQLDAGVRVLAKRGVKLEYRGNSAFVEGELSGLSRSGTVKKKSPAEPNP